MLDKTWFGQQEYDSRLFTFILCIFRYNLHALVLSKRHTADGLQSCVRVQICTAIYRSDRVTGLIGVRAATQNEASAGSPRPALRVPSYQHVIDGVRSSVRDQI